MISRNLAGQVCLVVVLCAGGLGTAEAQGPSITFGPDAAAVPALGSAALALLAGLLAFMGFRAARQRRAPALVACLGVSAAIAAAGSAELVRSVSASTPTTFITNPQKQTFPLVQGLNGFQNDSGAPLNVLAIDPGACSIGSTGQDCTVGQTLAAGALCDVSLNCFQDSDRRLKTAIEQVGTTVHGLPLYHFNYRDRPGRFEGVMAQDVLAVMPQAVTQLDSGYLAVDYGLLGAPFRRVR